MRDKRIDIFREKNWIVTQYIEEIRYLDILAPSWLWVSSEIKITTPSRVNIPNIRQTQIKMKILVTLG